MSKTRLVLSIRIESPPMAMTSLPSVVEGAPPPKIIITSTKGDPALDRETVDKALAQLACKLSEPANAENSGILATAEIREVNEHLVIYFATRGDCTAFDGPDDRIGQEIVNLIVGTIRQDIFAKHGFA